MKAVYITEHGGSDVLTYGDLPEPSVGPTDVLVRVRACSVNRLDVYTRAGVRGTRRRLDEPYVLGGDASGDVVEVGEEVSSIRPGDRVVLNPRLSCGQCHRCAGDEEELCTEVSGAGGYGGYAEMVAAPARSAVLLPDSVSYVQAASLPTVFLPCWTILIRRGALKPTETALVLSASSGVGTAGIQVAKSVVGARVIATTSTKEKARKARELGADEVINYNEEDVADAVAALTDGHGVDVVLDHVGTDFWPAAISSLAVGGRYGVCGVTTGYRADLQLGTLFLKSQTVFGAFMGRTDELRKIVELTGQGVIRGIVHETFPLEEAARAHETMEGLNFFGKLVLTMP